MIMIIVIYIICNNISPKGLLRAKGRLQAAGGERRVLRGADPVSVIVIAIGLLLPHYYYYPYVYPYYYDYYYDYYHYDYLY